MAVVEAGRIYIDVDSNSVKATSDMKLFNDQIVKTSKNTASLRSQMAVLNSSEKLLGNSAEVAAQKQALLKTKIQQLLASGVNPANKGIQNLARQYKNLERNMRPSTLSRIRSGWLGIAASLAVVFTAFNRLIDVTQRQVEADIRLNAVLRSTGQAANLTFNELKNMASGLQSVTTYGDEAINEAQALLLTFTSIGRDVFPQALESILNVSTGMRQDLQTSVQQLGRALNDPIKGMAALTRVGIQFNEQQRQQIETMQRSGNIVGAQRVILRELETQFGGLARAIAQTPFGRLEQLRNTLGDIAEEIGNRVLPGLDELARAFQDVVGEGENTGSVLGDVLSQISFEIAKAIRGIRILIGAIRVAGTAFNALQRGGQLGTDEELFNAVEDLTEQYEAYTESILRFNKPQGIAGGTTGGGAAIRQSITGGAGGAGGGTTGMTLAESEAEAERIYQQDLENYKNLLRAKDQADRDAAEARINQMKETFSAVLSISSEIVSGLSELFKMSANNEIQRIENVYDKRAELIKNKVKDEERQAKLLEQLEAQKSRNILKVQRDAAKKQQAISVFETIINTARGALGAFALASSTIPPPAGQIIGGIAAAAVTALGAAKIGLITSQQLPAAQFGGSFEVPPGYSADSALLRLNSGETATITQSKDTGVSENNIYVSIDGYSMRAYITDVANDIMNNGSVQITRKGVVKAS